MNRASSRDVLVSMSSVQSLTHCSIVRTARSLEASSLTVVVGHEAEAVKVALEGHQDLAFVTQVPQLGTGHAVQQAMPHLQDDGTTLVLSGDVPLIQPETLQTLLAMSDQQHLALLCLQTPHPTGYGRLVRNAQQQVVAIVEAHTNFPVVAELELKSHEHLLAWSE